MMTISEATSKCFLMIRIPPDGLFDDAEGNERNRGYLLVTDSIGRAPIGVCLMKCLAAKSVRCMHASWRHLLRYTGSSGVPSNFLFGTYFR